ncbi:conserved hypothetical protein [Ricinus communis]|uniref:Pectinesterase inhibitor domain-containing protein n=1 Tax=Ricinus communis TaxID=3988 RepID=B9SE92_RICCO|nr:conserved hypothetical protein [Ricinus communis]
MDSRNFLFIFATISLYLSPNFPCTANAQAEAALAISISPNKLVTNVCQQTDNFAFCMQVMKSRPQILSAKSVKTVADFALAVARKESIITHNFFSRVAGSTKKNPASKAAFVQCAKYFNETVSMFNLNGLENGEASLDVHYALDNAKYCETALAGAKVHNALITARIRLWKNYFSVAYTTVMILEDKTPSGR